MQGQVVHPRPQTPQIEPVAKPETFLLINLNSECKSLIERRPIVCYPSCCSKWISVDRNIKGRCISAYWILKIFGPYLYYDLYFQLRPSSSMVQSNRLSICPPVHHTFSIFPSPCHPEIFLGVITIDRNDVYPKSQGQRSQVKVTEAKINCVPIWAFLERNSSFNSQMATKWCTKLKVV